MRLVWHIFHVRNRLRVLKRFAVKSMGPKYASIVCSIHVEQGKCILKQQGNQTTNNNHTRKATRMIYNQQLTLLGDSEDVDLCYCG